MRRLRRWLRGRQLPHSLAQALDAESSALHPADVSRVYLCLYQVQQRGSPEDKAALEGCVRDLVEKYDSAVPPIHTEIAALRAELGPARGPAVPGRHGGFRRGDAVCRKLGDQVEDAVILEFEPSTEHSRRFGRMAGVQVLEVDSSRIDRWFVDQIRPARDMGRPW